MMKYIKYYLFFIALLLIGGCDFLNHDKDTIITKNDVFHTQVRTKEFLTNIYLQVPGGLTMVGASMLAAGSDDAEQTNTQNAIQKINNGAWSAVVTVDPEWNSSYTAIRAANKFLANFNIHNYDQLKYNQDYPELLQQLELYPYEARFLRALFYFKLLKRYGHVPLITKPLTLDEANHVKPSDYKTVTKFIVDECDSIAPRLPVSYSAVPNKETGRATRGAAMALKAKALLYAASPLHNPQDGLQKWVDAAKAAKAIIDSSYYSLDPDYSDIFNNRTSPEIIWDRRLGSINDFEADNFPIGYIGANGNSTAPTQNLVDAYEMQSTGLPITDPVSGYDPQHPYQGRDPRLRETVILNNSSWKNRNVQLWHDGEDGQPKQKASRTGYYLKKYVVEGVSLDPAHATTEPHDWVVFRLGGILLDYAEAMNEAYGPDNAADMGMTARQAADKVRERSNMPDFPAGLGKAQFRKKIHNERRVEMAFENQRFWDIRRWKIGLSTVDIKGMDIKKEGADSFDYNVKTIEHRVWNSRMNLFPIPQSEINKNPGLKQNPGW
jgi:hypothetical protein